MGWRWASLRSDLEQSVRDSILAHQWAWEMGVPRPSPLLRQSVALVEGAAAAVLQLLDGREDAWTDELDSRVRGVPGKGLMIDALHLASSIEPSDFEELDAAGSRPGLASLLLRVRCLLSLQALAEGDPAAASDAVWKELDPAVREGLFEMPALRGLRRAAARRGGGAWGQRERELPDWVSRLVEGEPVSRPVAAFYSEWVIAQARSLHRSTRLMGALDGMRSAARRLELARAHGNVVDRWWPARVVDRLEEELEEQLESSWMMEAVTPA